MRFDIVTLFPEMPLLIEKFGITARAAKLGLWQLKCWNPRDFVFDAHKTVDDRPFGGGPGMVLLAEPLADAVDAIARTATTAKLLRLRLPAKRSMTTKCVHWLKTIRI